jgi:hypothetical protein
MTSAPYAASRALPGRVLPIDASAKSGRRRGNRRRAAVRRLVTLDRVAERVTRSSPQVQVGRPCGPGLRLNYCGQRYRWRIEQSLARRLVVIV